MTAQSLNLGDGVAWCQGDTFWGNQTGINLYQSNTTWGSYQCRSQTTSNPRISYGYQLTGCVWDAEDSLVRCPNPLPTTNVEGVFINHNWYASSRLPWLTNPWAPWGTSLDDFWFIESFSSSCTSPSGSGCYSFTYAQQSVYAGDLEGGVLRARDNPEAYTVFNVETSDPTAGLTIGGNTWLNTPSVNYNGWFVDGLGDTLSVQNQIGQYWVGYGIDYIWINPLTPGDMTSLLDGSAEAGIVFQPVSVDGSCLFCIYTGSYILIENLTLQYLHNGIYLISGDHLTMNNLFINHNTHSGVIVGGTGMVLSNSWVNDSTGNQAIVFECCSTCSCLISNTKSTYAGHVAGYNGYEPSAILMNGGIVTNSYTNMCGWQCLEAIGGALITNNTLVNSCVAMDDCGTLYCQSDCNGVVYSYNNATNVIGNTFSLNNANHNLACFYVDNGGSYVTYNGNTCQGISQYCGIFGGSQTNITFINNICLTPGIIIDNITIHSNFSCNTQYSQTGVFPSNIYFNKITMPSAPYYSAGQADLTFLSNLYCEGANQGVYNAYDIEFNSFSIPYSRTPTLTGEIFIDNYYVPDPYFENFSQFNTPACSNVPLVSLCS